uniref:Putative salivary secreted lipocalin n=1 Tax=Ornithodoros turicata TaxID=34597 RepID=A0A2R5LG97_9ACAR
MYCKIALVVFCLFVVGYVDAANDVWKVLGGADAGFFLVSRTYSRGGGNHECAYMKRTRKDKSSHTLTALMGYRDKATQAFPSATTYTVTAKQDATGVYSEITVKAGSVSLVYELVHSDGKGCNILKGKTGRLEGKCELWATPQQVTHAKGDVCSKQFKSLCEEPVERPYLDGCEIPA